MTYEASTDAVQNTQTGSEGTNIYEMSDEELLKVESMQEGEANDNPVPAPEITSSGSEAEQHPENVIPETPEQEAAPVDWEAALTAPFKANGTMIQVSTPEEAIRLMQQGAGFTKKMEAIKPYKGVLQTIQSEGITERDLQMLIDARKGDKAAIAQLMQSTGIDSYDLPNLEEEPYVPQTEIITPEQAAFLEVAQDIQSRPYGGQLIDTLTSWDDVSKAEVYKDPSLMYALADDVESGLFGHTMAVINNDRILGRITPEWDDRSFYELYNHVAMQLKEQMNASQMNPAPVRESLPVQQQQQYFQQETVPVSAAIPQSEVVAQQRQQAFSLDDLFSMSDEEIRKLTGN